jgi:hypothetical protein
MELQLLPSINKRRAVDPNGLQPGLLTEWDGCLHRGDPDLHPDNGDADQLGMHKVLHYRTADRHDVDALATLLVLGPTKIAQTARSGTT